jgi:quinol-cytochrome oxidoreductase complex cytochrome b subunit
VTPEVIKPEWFFYVAFRWLKLFSGTAAVLSMGLIVFTMFAWPFIDGWIRRARERSEASVWIGIAATLFILALTLGEAAVEH